MGRIGNFAEAGYKFVTICSNCQVSSEVHNEEDAEFEPKQGFIQHGSIHL